MASNLEFPQLSSNLLPQNCNLPSFAHTIEVHIDIDAQFEHTGPYGVKYHSDNSIDINFTHSCYHLLLTDNTIIVHAPSVEIVFLTLFNVPFSLLLNHLGIFVLHSCSCTFNGRLLAFTAEKGTGKSTLLIKMLRLGARMFSDDCLVIKENFISYNSHSYMKIKDRKHIVAKKSLPC